MRVIARLVFACCAFFSSAAIAETVSFKSGPHFCKLMSGTVIGADTCEVNVVTKSADCDVLRQNSSKFRNQGSADVNIEALTSGNKSYCGRRSVPQLLSIAQFSRKEAMSAVSLGMDETICDPAKVGFPDRCDQRSLALYFLYMCAAHLCKLQ